MELINGRYELRSEIRRGGFGVTWYAWDVNLDMPVAIKEFSDPDPEHRHKFIQEARTLARFSGNRGIVNVRDYLEIGDKAYMVMEYLDGEDLSVYVDKKGGLSCEETMRLLKPVMDVLKKLHAENILHRDVSPDNIRITDNGEVKLLDFGSVTNLTSENLTRTVTVKPGYAPVEQYSGAAGQGPWTDVYSLCATIYKCITGKKPMDSLMRSFHDELVKPSELGVKIDPMMEEALMKGLSIRPEDRYQSISALEEALNEKQPVKDSSAVNGNNSDLAARAFSDEVNAVPPSKEDVVQANSDLAAKAFGGGTENHPAAAVPITKKVPTAQAVPAGTAFTEKAEGKAVKKEKQQKGKRKGKPIIPLILAGAVILVAVFVMIKGRDIATNMGVVEGVEYKSGDNYIILKNITIGDSEINYIKGIEEIEWVSMYNCQIPDEVMKRMPELSAVRDLTFDYCVGYSSLDPLASMPALESLTLFSGYDYTLAGDQLITTDFPETLKRLTVYYEKLDGSTEFMRHFPGITYLNFYIIEGGYDVAFLDSMPKLNNLTLEGVTMDEEACSHLYGHPDLYFVTLNDTELVTLDWVKDSPNISAIYANNTRVNDLSPLAGHENLKYLQLSHTEISDLTPLQSCKGLGELYIDHSKVVSLSGLEGHKDLYYLDISYCGVSDLSPLSDSDLMKLIAPYNDISTLEPLSNCSDMINMNLNGNELTDLKGCEGMIKLETLRAARNHITDISGISNSTSLETLQISENEITDTSGLSNGFVNLTLVDIADNSISDISFLTNCPELKAISAENNVITSIESLAGKEKLNAALLANNELTDISALKDSCNSLAYLDIGNNKVSDISFLSGLAVKQVQLIMENNNITDLSILPPLLNYHELAFYGNPIKDVSIFEKMEKLTGWPKLYLTYDEDMDYASLGRSYFKNTVTLVDVPNDKKAAVLKTFKESSNYYEPSFMTSEEADAELAEYRANIKAELIGGQEETEEENDG